MFCGHCRLDQSALTRAEQLVNTYYMGEVPSLACYDKVESLVILEARAWTRLDTCCNGVELHSIVYLYSKG